MWGAEVASKGMSMITGTLYDRIIKKRNIRDFNEFQIVILDIWELLGAPSNNVGVPSTKREKAKILLLVF